MKRYDKAVKHVITLTLNGMTRTGHAESRMLLVDFLRHELGVTGTHVGCEHGVCGACTVLVNGVATRSCLQLAVQSDGMHIETGEGLNRDCPGERGDLQQAFKSHHALQCGFCTAGILMSCTDFLKRVSMPTRQQVTEMLSGHLCRCTGYTNIVDAVMDVATQRMEKKRVEHA
jgi:2-furoyl-CoA dehydrogenase 2Fe-2S iron sulfur subunit